MKDGIYLVNNGPSLKTYLPQKAAGPAWFAVPGAGLQMPKPGEAPANYCLIDEPRKWFGARLLVKSDMAKHLPGDNAPALVQLVLVGKGQSQELSWDQVDQYFTKLVGDAPPAPAAGPPGASVVGGQS